MFHLIGVGILIAIGFYLAPYVIALIIYLIPGLIGGAVGLALSLYIFGSALAVLICTLIGLILPYWLIKQSNS
jgi:hypothetical protein